MRQRFLLALIAIFAAWAARTSPCRAAGDASAEVPTTSMHHQVNFKFMKDQAAVNELDLDKNQLKAMTARIAKARKDCENFLAANPGLKEMDKAKKIYQIFFQCNNDYMKLLPPDDMLAFNDRVWVINNEVLALTNVKDYRYRGLLERLGLDAAQTKKMDELLAAQAKTLQAIARKYPPGRDGGQAWNYHTVEACFGARKAMWQIFTPAQRTAWLDALKPQRPAPSHQRGVAHCLNPRVAN